MSAGAEEAVPEGFDRCVRGHLWSLDDDHCRTCIELAEDEWDAQGG